MKTRLEEHGCPHCDESIIDVLVAPGTSVRAELGGDEFDFTVCMECERILRWEPEFRIFVEATDEEIREAMIAECYRRMWKLDDRMSLLYERGRTPRVHHLQSMRIRESRAKETRPE